MFGFRLVMVDGAQAESTRARPVGPMSERPNDKGTCGTFQQLRELAECATVHKVSYVSRLPPVSLNQFFAFLACRGGRLRMAFVEFGIA